MLKDRDTFLLLNASTTTGLSISFSRVALAAEHFFNSQIQGSTRSQNDQLILPAYKLANSRSFLLHKCATQPPVHKVAEAGYQNRFRN